MGIKSDRTKFPCFKTRKIKVALHGKYCIVIRPLFIATQVSVKIYCLSRGTIALF